MLRGAQRGWMAAPGLRVVQKMPQARQGHSPVFSLDTARRSLNLRQQPVGHWQETKVQVRQNSKGPHGTRCLNQLAWNSHKREKKQESHGPSSKQLSIFKLTVSWKLSLDPYCEAHLPDIAGHVRTTVAT